MATSTITELLLVHLPDPHILVREVEVGDPADLADLGADPEDPEAGWTRLELDDANAEEVVTRTLARARRTTTLTTGVTATSIPSVWGVWRRQGRRGRRRYTQAASGPLDAAAREAVKEARRATARAHKPRSRVTGAREDIIELVRLGLEIARDAGEVEGLPASLERRLSAHPRRLVDGDLRLVEVVAELQLAAEGA